MNSTLHHKSVRRNTFKLPPEILLNIFQRLMAHDIKSVRKVCWLFYRSASPYLIRLVYISGLHRDLEVLKAVSEYPLFAKHVAELVFSTSIFDKRLVTDKMQKKNYERYLRRQIKDGKHFDHELTEEDLSKSHERYLDYYWEQRDSFESGDPIICLATALPLLPKLQKLRVVKG